MSIAGQNNSRMTIVGMGLTGLSCARYFAARQIPFRIVDSRKNPPLFMQINAEFPDVEKNCGEFAHGLFDSTDTLVISPGVALTEPSIAFALAQGARLSSDIELFLREINVPVVAITGSNGKSTVTTLVGEMFRQSGQKTCVAGNIGVPVLEQLLGGQRYDVFVIELSSFQLERLECLAADAVTILNVTEDHMDRYDSFNHYLAAKQRIFRGAMHVVVNRDDALSFPAVAISCPVASYGLSIPDTGEFGLLEFDGAEWIVFGVEKLFPVNDLKIKGRHNIANAMAAMALCRCMQIDWQPILSALQNFAGLRHRCEWVDDIDGVSFYNDSKATNVGAAVAAIGGFTQQTGKLFLIAGGLDKDSDFTPMAEVVRAKVEHVFLIGQDARKLEDAIGTHLCTNCPDLLTAVKAANDIAKEGDVVLLAPACASFDMFKNYEDRGESFVRAVKELRR